MALLVAVLLIGAGSFVWLSGTMPGKPAIGGPFTLEGAHGQAVSSAAFRGKYMLIYFGYTYCPDVCPTTLTAVAAALDKMGAKGAALVPIFITVDPARDTPAVMQRYAAAFSPRIVGLTGSAAQIAAVEKEYRVYAAKHKTGPGPNDYLMDHSSLLYLMGPDGKFLAPVRADESGAEMARDLESLMHTG
ncbi:MAG: SCO family protein [Rhodospirillales bacterium]|nr:SCO family protein [Rhodospirillales bacterium]